MGNFRLKISVVIFFLAYLPSLSFAITGQGYGDDEAFAKREALSHISSQISVQVRNRFQSSQSSDSQKGESQRVENVIETHSDLPILGAVITVDKKGGRMFATATLAPEKSLPLYEKRMGSLRVRITEIYAGLKKAADNAEKYDSIMESLSLLDEFEKLNVVAVFLGGNPEGPGTSETELRQMLRGVTKTADSLEMAAKILSAGMTQSGIYVYPAKTRHSSEITQFASVLKDKMAIGLKISKFPQNAAYFLIGEYEASGDGIDVTYHLVDTSAMSEKTNTVRIVKKAYGGLQTEPTTADFDKLLQSGVALSGNLRVEISSNLGSRDLLFHEGDEVEFMVKLNEPGYFYIVGHTVKEEEKNSYLLELHEGDGPRRFVYFVNADDANKWISMGKFDVVRPFGVESLQVFASNKDIVDSLPAVSLDKKTGLHLISTSPKEGVLKTRAVIKKLSKTAQTSEGSLVFTTMAK
jgi:hypothetical protein